MVKLHEISPREQDGRDTLSRYKAQTKAAGLASLEILNNQSVNRVFCDWHDDFVIQKIINGKTVYHFVQVKTKSKQNYQWSLMDLLGVNNTNRKKDSAEIISNSYAGKLLAHTVNFNGTCERVVFLTNVYVKDEVENLLLAIKKHDTKNKTLSKLLEHFETCFCKGESLYTDSEIKDFLSKLVIDQGAEHIKVEGDQFETIAKSKVFEFSEIDLQHTEAKEILESLLTLIDSKSIGILPDNLSEKELDKLTGIGLDDLLGILCISKIAYQSLVDGGDTKALKHLSILQRILKQTNTPDNMIDYAAKCKTEWDIWYRENRLTIPEFEMTILESKLSEAIKNTVISGNLFLNLEDVVGSIISSTDNNKNLISLTDGIILGGLFSVLVRSN